MPWAGPGAGSTPGLVDGADIPERHIEMTDQEIRQLLSTAKTIAVVGLSDKPWRPSHGVSEYMQKQGYRIIPVNPNLSEALGEKAYASLEEVPDPIDIVNIFRRSEAVEPVVNSAIRIGARAVWMQEGVVHREAAERARRAGIAVIMDRCILKEHRKRFRMAADRLA
jgi:predicted CoA-binding protein